jgi:hypothetical protein
MELPAFFSELEPTIAELAGTGAHFTQLATLPAPLLDRHRHGLTQTRTPKIPPPTAPPLAQSDARGARLQAAAGAGLGQSGRVRGGATSPTEAKRGSFGQLTRQCHARNSGVGGVAKS